MSVNNRISVSLRIRPLCIKEIQQGSINNWQWDINNKTIQPTCNNSNYSSPDATCTVDEIFDPTATNHKVYTNIVSSIVENSVVRGISGSVLAYGMTSSGKSYTMSALIESTCNEIFNLITRETCNNNRTITVKLSYFEIYNENIRDLLNCKKSNQYINKHENIEIRDLGDDGITISGLKEEIVENKNQILKLFALGYSNKSMGSTAINDNSSRSHTIFRLHILNQPNENCDDTCLDDNTYRSYLQLVDLAGSERVAKTLAVGKGLAEGGAINKSLLALSLVIRKLSEQSSLDVCSGFIEYRSSILTHVLKSSLGGNCLTSIICCITYSNYHEDETLSTLRFASIAKRVECCARPNQIVDDKITIKLLKKELNIVKKQLQLANQAGKSNPELVSFIQEPIQPCIDKIISPLQENINQLSQFIDLPIISACDSCSTSIDEKLFLFQARFNEIKEYITKLKEEINNKTVENNAQIAKIQRMDQLINNIAQNTIEYRNINPKTVDYKELEEIICNEFKQFAEKINNLDASNRDMAARIQELMNIDKLKSAQIWSLEGSVGIHKSSIEKLKSHINLLSNQCSEQRNINKQLTSKSMLLQESVEYNSGKENEYIAEIDCLKEEIEILKQKIPSELTLLKLVKAARKCQYNKNNTHKTIIDKENINPN